MKTKVIFTIIALSCSFVFSQTKVADKFFDKFAYIKASELYEESFEKGDDSQHVLTRLGDCYYNNSNSEKAALWYGKAVNKYSKIDPEYIFKYIQSLRSLAKYDQANQWLDRFKELQKDDRRIKEFESLNSSLFDDLTSTEGKYVETKNLPSNSEYSEFGTYMHNGKIFFASSKISEDGGKKKLYKWNEQPFLDIYEGEISSSQGDSIANAGLIASDEINTDYHEATIAITNDGKTMYFTRDNVTKRKRLGYDKDGTTHLKIYKATLVSQRWQNVEELPFNSKVYSTGHPALSPDNKTLYFVSDREGGFGQTDLYSVEIGENGSYGAVKNLGPEINTEGREMFPFIAKDSTMYFSSDGHINLGLLDIFKSNILKDEKVEVENLGAPINSGSDDFAFFKNEEDEDQDKGYFSSNRPGGSGGDDIYSYNTFKCKQKVKGIVRDKRTLDPIPMAIVQLIDENGKILEEVQSNENGEYQFDVDCEKTYTLYADKADYRDDTKDLETTEIHDFVHEVDIFLTPLIIDNQIVINPIFFDFDKSDIRPDAAYELENVVAVMKEHPKMIIKIEAHTDSRGRDKYNLKLSDRRAKSTRDYIFSRNIAQNRIQSATGFGESQLINKCSNGVECSEVEHQENRRSKFIILNEYR